MCELIANIRSVDVFSVEEREQAATRRMLPGVCGGYSDPKRGQRMFTGELA